MIAVDRASRISLPACFIAAILSLVTALTVESWADDLQSAFDNPPAAARPWVFWYWNKGAISQDGINADLEAMHDAGIGGAYLMPIKGPDPKLWNPPVVQLSPEWWNMVRHALSGADRLGLEIAMHACDGFATAGGPWITPDKSMQKIVWSEMRVSGGKLIKEQLPKPPTNEGYYRDIAVFALPRKTSIDDQVPAVTTSSGEEAQFLADPGNDRRVRFDEPGWIQYEYVEPFTCRTITVHPDGNSFQANRLLVIVSDGGDNFRELGRLEPPRHGWQNGDGTVTHSFVATTARFFRFTYDPAGTEPGAEDLDSAKWKPSLKLQGLELSSQPRIHQFESKNGSVWRVSQRTTAEQIADGDCIPLEEVLNITEHLQPDGTLEWNAPPGEWIMLRMGHTSTGAHNETGGGGRGLECDKFNPDVVRLQFDKWFGEISRQVGPELTKRVLKVFHVDSWECGSQNWSAVFPAEFENRRGYDIMPYLPVLAGYPITSADVSERVLYDVRQTIADLIADIFFGTLSELAHEHGCRFSAECVAPTMVSDGQRHFGVVDIPMGEFWLRSPTHDKPNDMLDAISAAHIYGKPLVQAEAFTELRMAWDEHPGMLKALGDRQLALGANRLVYHVFNHNPWTDRRPGMTLDQIGLFFQRDQTWWPTARAWTDYHARCQAMLQAGVPVVDIAVFTGEGVPSRAVLAETLVTTLPGVIGKDAVRREQERLANVGGPIRELPRGVNHSANISNPQDWIDPLRGYAYDSVNADALLRLAEVKDGRICFPGGASYQMLVLSLPRPLAPHPELMSPALATKLGNLVDAGATVVACVHGRRSPSLTNYPQNDAELLSILGNPPPAGTNINERPGSVRQIGSGRLIYGPIEADSFSRYNIEPDFLCFTTEGKRVNDVAWNHRRSGDADWYFLSNQSDKTRQLILSLRIKGKQPEIWDPVTQEIHKVRSWGVANGRMVFSLQFEPSGSLFVVFRRETQMTVSKAGLNWTQFEELQTLGSPWRVQFDPANGGPEQPVEFPALTDWSKYEIDKIRHYSGTAVYRQTFKWSNAAPRVWVDLGEVANVAEVRVNNTACGSAWTPSYRVEITKALRQGENELEIAVTNTWANRLIGDSELPAENRITWMTAPYPPADAELLPAGLPGPVTLVCEATKKSPTPVLREGAKEGAPRFGISSEAKEE